MSWQMTDDSGALITYGNDIWSDGDYIYYSDDHYQLELIKSTGRWANKTWTYPSGLSYILGVKTWSDGVDVYYCANGITHYILDKDTSTWSEVTLTNAPSAFEPQDVWSDGNNIYYNAGGLSSYVFDRTTKTWSEKVWSGVPSNYANASLYGRFIWSDGNNIYYNDWTTSLVLDLATSTWESTSWTGLANTDFAGVDIWLDGENTYFTHGNTYRLDVGSRTWILESTLGISNSYGQYIWKDYDGNIYYSEIYLATIKEYVLKNPVNTKTCLK